MVVVKVVNITQIIKNLLVCGNAYLHWPFDNINHFRSLSKNKSNRKLHINPNGFNYYYRTVVLVYWWCTGSVLVDGNL